jgi:hypothetical protein
MVIEFSRTDRYTNERAVNGSEEHEVYRHHKIEASS